MNKIALLKNKKWTYDTKINKLWLSLKLWLLPIRWKGDVGNQWEFESEGRVWRTLGSDFFSRLWPFPLRSYVFVCRSLLLCLPFLWHLYARAFALHMEETRMRVQCGLFNTGGKEGEMAVSSPLKRFQEELQGGQGVWPQIFQTRKSGCCCCKEQCFSLKLF